MGSCTRVRRSTLGVIVHGRRLPSAATADALIVTDAFAPLALRHQPWPRRLSRGLVNLDLMRLQWGEASGICRNAHCARRCGREAEGGGLLNRYRVVKLYRGFESLRLRQSSLKLLVFSGCRPPIPTAFPTQRRDLLRTKGWHDPGRL